MAYEFLESNNIKLPELYNLGFAHNNCHGFCVKSGQKQATLLHNTQPEVYAFAEDEQEAFKQTLPIKRQSQVGYIRKVEKGVTKYLTLKDWRENYLGITPDNDMMGCGCFTSGELDE
jgi:hypothetical protein